MAQRVGGQPVDLDRAGKRAGSCGAPHFAQTAAEAAPSAETEQASGRVLGVDPGLCRTGYAVLERGPEGPLLLEGGVIRSTARQPLATRVKELYDGLREVFAQFRPAAMAIEQVFSAGRFPKSALLMSHARGAILLAAAQQPAPVAHYSARQIKRMLTGSGNADKGQMQRAIQREFRLDRLLEPHDVADAAAVALCHFHVCRQRPAALQLLERQFTRPAATP